MKYVLVAKNTMLKLIQQLPIKEQKVILAHYGITDGKNQTFAEIGKFLHCSRQYAQVLEASALKKLLEKVRIEGYYISDIETLRKSLIYYDREKLYLWKIVGCTYDELIYLKDKLNDQTKYYPVLFKVHGPNLDEEQDMDILTYPERCLYFQVINILKRNYQKLIINKQQPKNFYVNHTLNEIIGCTDEQLDTLIKYIRLDTNVYAIMQKAFGPDFKQKFKKTNLDNNEYIIFRDCIVRLKEHNKCLFIKRKVRKHICYHNKKLFEILGCRPEDIMDLSSCLKTKDYLLMQKAFGNNLDEVYKKDDISKVMRGQLTPIVTYLFNRYLEPDFLDKIEIAENIRKNLIFNTFLNFLPSNYIAIITRYLENGDSKALADKYSVNVLEINQIIANYLTWFKQIITSYENLFGIPMPNEFTEQLTNENFSSWENILLCFLPNDIKKIMISYNNMEEILWDSDSLDKITKTLTWFWTIQNEFKNIYQNEMPNRNWQEISPKLVKMRSKSKHLALA